MCEKMKMLKVIILLILALTMVSSTNAQIEKYFRKSVSLFRIEIPEDMTRRQGEYVYDALYSKLNSMGRFDYNPIPFRPGISIEKLFEIVKDYAEDQQLERAEKQFELMDEHYKEERITGETLDKIIAGAYIIIPRVDSFSKSVDSDKVTEKDGDTKYKYSVSVKYSLKVEVWNAANIGSEENPNWEPYLEDSFTISTIGKESQELNKKVKSSKLEESLADEAVRNSLFLLDLQMGKALKQLDMFIIKAQVTDANLKTDRIKFNFGKNVGLHVDDPFKVLFFEKNPDGSKKKIEVAYMKVRKVWEDESQAQVLILQNPYRVKEKELINPGDQVLEHPKMGLNIIVKTGSAPLFMEPDSEGIWMTYYDGYDNYYFESDQGVVNGVGSLTLGIEFNLAPLLGISETYLYEDNTLLFNAPMIGGLAELGYRKRFYKRRLAGFYGIGLGVFGMTGNIGTVPNGNVTGADFMYQTPGDPSSDHIPAGSDVLLTGYSVGLNFSGGFNYLFTPEAAMTFEAGYRSYPHINGGLWTIEAQEGDETWELDIADFTNKPPAAKILGLWWSVGFIISL